MTADNDCPVDLGDLHIRLDDYNFMQAVGNEQLDLVCRSRPVVAVSKTASQTLFTNHVDTSLPFCDDIESWCCHSAPNSDLLSLTHDELILQATDCDFNPDSYLNLLQEPAAMLHSSSYVSPEVSRPCTPSCSPVQNLSPNAYVKSGSLSTSPEVPSFLAAYMEKQENNHGQRRESIDSGSEKKEQKVPRHKRPSHIRAETKRRGKIQDCFNQLTQLVPMVVDNDVKAASGLSRKTKAVVLSQRAGFLKCLSDHSVGLII